MNARFLGLVVFALVLGSGACRGQSPGTSSTPFRDWQYWQYLHDHYESRNGFLVPRARKNDPPASSPSRSRTQPRRSEPTQSRFPLLSDYEFLAPNLKIHFKVVRVGGAVGAQLTRTPPRDSGVSNVSVNGSPVRLKPGDVIYRLDSLPIRAAVDVMNHHGRTLVSFIDHRTGMAFTGVTDLPAYTPPPDDAPKELFATNLGMHYQLVPLGKSIFGARVSRTASAGTPAGALQLEARRHDRPARWPANPKAGGCPEPRGPDECRVHQYPDRPDPDR